MSELESWENLELFQGIDLNDSFVLDWAWEGKSLIFDIEFSIWPESVFIRHPKKVSSPVTS